MADQAPASPDTIALQVTIPLLELNVKYRFGVGVTDAVGENWKYKT